MSAASEVADEAVALYALVGHDAQHTLLDIAREATQVGVEPGVGQGSADYFYLNVGDLQFQSLPFTWTYISVRLLVSVQAACKWPAGGVWYLHITCIDLYSPV